MKSRSVIIEQTGGPQVLKLIEQEVSAPGPGELLIRHCAIGVNFIDTYHRSGLYPLPLPSGVGLEAAGVVEALGNDVDDFNVGDRIGYCWGPPGGYADYRLIAAERVVKLPEDIGDDLAAAVLLKGCTVEYLIRRCYPVARGDWVLLHAAAGGVGQIALQWLKTLGAYVIATAGSEDKRALVKALGADHVLDYGDEDWPQQLREIRPEGVAVVFDGVGQATFMTSLDCLARRGVMVSFGNASGPVAPFPANLLSQKGSLYVTRPTLMDYYVTAEERRRGTTELFDLLRQGKIKIDIGQRYDLKDAQQTHRDLEARRTTGSSLLLP